MARGRSEAPLRVVYVDHVARWSGGEIALARLLQALNGEVEAHVILGEDGDLVRALEAIDGVTVEVLPMDEGLRDTRRGQVALGRLPVRTATTLLRYVWRLRRRLKELEPDLVHTNSLKAAFYGGAAARLARIPVVWHVRDRIAPDYLPGPAVHLVRTTARWLPTAVVANSRNTLETLPAGVRSSVLYDPLPMTPGSPDLDTAARDGTGRSLRVGVLGRLAEWKGQHVFLEAFARAFPDGDEQAWLVGSAMFGEAGYEQRLRDLAASLGIADRVVWRGFRDDVDAELRELDVLVHCSITPEPFGQVVVEGMAAGLPVVAARAGGPLEIIAQGHDGLLVEPGDVDALAEVLRTLAASEELRCALGATARESSRRFSPAAAAQQIGLVYAEIATQPT